MLSLSHRLPPVRYLYKELGKKVSKKNETTKKIFATNGLIQLVATSAENFLNKNVAEEGYCFGFGECGDFMYMPISWWSEE